MPSLRPGSDALSDKEKFDRRMVSGRACFGTALRIVDDAGNELPRDGNRRNRKCFIQLHQIHIFIAIPACLRQ